MFQVLFFRSGKGGGGFHPLFTQKFRLDEKPLNLLVAMKMQFKILLSDH